MRTGLDFFGEFAHLWPRNDGAEVWDIEPGLTLGGGVPQECLTSGTSLPVVFFR